MIACILRGSEALMPFGVCPRVACVGLISVVALFITPITYTTAKDQCKCEVRMLNKKIQCSSPLGHHGQSLFPSLVQCHQPPSSLPANAGSFLLAFFLPRSGMQFKVKFFLRHHPSLFLQSQWRHTEQKCSDQKKYGVIGKEMTGCPSLERLSDCEDYPQQSWCYIQDTDCAESRNGVRTLLARRQGILHCKLGII